MKPCASKTSGSTQLAVREQDRFMPIANVIRIMRKVLPTHAKISDDAKETIQECVSEYISFITSEANERCQREQRKTITAEDVLWAMSKLGFDDYIDPLSVYLHRYRELEGDHRGSIRGEPLQLKRAAVVSYHLPSTSGPHHFQHQPGTYGAVPCEGLGGAYLGAYGDPETASLLEPGNNLDTYAHYK
ncbi:nuclear transcription factor Y subunit B-1-like [Phalaenopsis equestris]|uniref:nuclear transcription factor Y subunit B-1-like n=1 Tax=Phalaenopsis equestris TaxID=78828 RepID=UPI0009E485D4|nr:nuclear transcription factor Y subunit B-1-like [Phalaenopsis equestris]